MQLNRDQPAKRLAHADDATANDARTTNDSGKEQTPAAVNLPNVVAAPPQTSPPMQPPAVPLPSHSIASSKVDGSYSTNSNGILYDHTVDLFSAPNMLGFHGKFDDLGWTGSFDPYLWPASFDLGQELGMIRDLESLDANLRHVNSSVSASSAALRGLPPIPASHFAELYVRSQSPIMDRDAVEVRQYHATSIEIDAPLHFPDIDAASLLDAEIENQANVEPLSHEKVRAIEQLAEETQREPHHHPFTSLKLPPQAVLNSWIQLYFAHFHPVFPIIHKPTWSLPDVDPLLVLAVAGIGAQFSRIKNAEAFAQGIHELVRRRSNSQIGAWLQRV